MEVTLNNGLITLTFEEGKLLYDKYGVGKCFGCQKGFEGISDKVIASYPKPNTVVLSLFEYIYLVNKNVIKKNDAIEMSKETTREYEFYKSIMDKGMYIKSGFKYGCDFVIYKKHPSECHSFCGVVLVENKERFEMKEVVGLIRLLHNVRKVLCVAFWNENHFDVVEMSWNLVDNKIHK